MVKDAIQSQPETKTSKLSLIEWYECDREAVLEILDAGEYNIKYLETKSATLNILPIQHAVIKNDYDFCEALIDAGANIEVLTAIEGRNLLHLAARYNASSAIRNLLIEAGVFLYSRDQYGDTPYDIASSFSMKNFLEDWDEDVPLVIGERVKFLEQQRNLEKAVIHHVSQGVNADLLQQIDVDPMSESQSTGSVVSSSGYSDVVHGYVKILASDEG